MQGAHLPEDGVMQTGRLATAVSAAGRRQMCGSSLLAIYAQEEPGGPPDTGGSGPDVPAAVLCRGGTG